MKIANQIEFHIHEFMAKYGGKPDFLYMGESEQKEFIAAVRQYLPTNAKTVNGATYREMQIVTVERLSFLEVGRKGQGEK